METIRKNSKIAILPPELSNQIAAGEVVERPAAVVKELIENSVDAGATRIEVEIEDGGIGLIRVIDNGSGMGREDAQLSLQRHATSKIHSVEDLFDISTLGFRGEALPSIAAVSRFSLTTRLSDELVGTQIRVEGGYLVETGRDAGGPVGTQIEIRDLFYNLPARLKFVKGESTEFNHIYETVLREALAFPQIHFRLKRSGKMALDLPSHVSVLERAQAALASRGRPLQDAVLQYGHEKIGPLSIEVCVGDPADSASSGRNVYLFVNHRFVKDRALLHAIVQAYDPLLGDDRFPLAVLYLQIPGNQVDVNVHPQKLEVRFTKGQEVFAAVQHTVQKTIAKAAWPLKKQSSSDVFGTRGDASYLYNTPSSFGMGLSSGMGSSAAENQVSYGQSPEGSFSGSSESSFLGPASLSNFSLNPSGSFLGKTAQVPFQGFDPALVVPTPPTSNERILFQQLNYLGQLHKTYLLCEMEDELLLVDQHAAHERVAFERLRTSQAKKTVCSQRLLFPLTFEVEPNRAAFITEYQALFEQLGFEIRPFGGFSFALLAVPDAAEFGRGAKTYQDPQKLIEKVLDDLEHHGHSETPQARTERVLATIACHSVVRAGDTLDGSAAKALFSSMDEVDFFPYCPHGRPALIRIKRSEIEKRFGRI